MGFIDSISEKLKMQAQAYKAVPDLRAAYPFKLSPSGQLAADKLQSLMADRYVQMKAGKITVEDYEKYVADAARMLAKVAQPDKSFGQHVKKVGTVLGGALVGLVTGGAAGAVGGFVSSAAAASAVSAGIAPTHLVDVATPPIVRPGPVSAGTGAERAGWGLVAIALAGLFLVKRMT